MATPIINNLVLIKTAILVLPDAGDSPTTGTIERTVTEGSARLYSGAYLARLPDAGSHVLFVREMATEVEIDEVEFLIMPFNAVVGVIPAT